MVAILLVRWVSGGFLCLEAHWLECRCVASTHFEYRYWRIYPGLTALESYSIYLVVAIPVSPSVLPATASLYLHHKPG